jgi:hypothetical protein
MNIRTCWLHSGRIPKWPTRLLLLQVAEEDETTDSWRVNLPDTYSFTPLFGDVDMELHCDLEGGRSSGCDDCAGQVVMARSFVCSLGPGLREGRGRQSFFAGERALPWWDEFVMGEQPRGTSRISEPGWTSCGKGILSRHFDVALHTPSVPSPRSWRPIEDSAGPCARWRLEFVLQVPYREGGGEECLVLHHQSAMRFHGTRISQYEVPGFVSSIERL